MLYFTLRGVSLRSPPLKAAGYESDCDDDFAAKSIFLEDMDDDTWI